MVSTYSNLYLDARRALRQAGVEQDQLEARELLAFAAGKTREELLRDMPLYTSDPVINRFREIMKRRLAGEPVAYIIGEWEFYGLTLSISKDVLIPRADTETLVERALETVRGRTDEVRVLDLCAGSGCIGLAVASRLPNATVVLGELSEGALRVCRENIHRCGFADRISSVRVNALENPPVLLDDFDLILSNPPYITAREMTELDPSVARYEPRMALYGGEDGLDFYRAIAPKWRRALRIGGKMIFEVGSPQAEAVAEILANSGYRTIQSFQDPGDHWRVVEGIRK